MCPVTFKLCFDETLKSHTWMYSRGVHPSIILLAGGWCPIIVYTLDCLRRREIFPKLIPWSLSALLLRVEIDYCLSPGPAD